MVDTRQTNATLIATTKIAITQAARETIFELVNKLEQYKEHIFNVDNQVSYYTVSIHNLTDLITLVHKSEDHIVPFIIKLYNTSALAKTPMSAFQWLNNSWNGVQQGQ